MSIKTKDIFSIYDYVAIVNSIAQEYFDEFGNYTPQFGLLNAMRVFYNDCVIESKFNVPHDISKAEDMQIFINDEEFIESFNESIASYGVVKLDFSNAYKDAMDIVNYKKNTNNELVTMIKQEISNISNLLSNLTSNDSIEKLEKIASEISSGNLSSEAIADAVGGSDYIKKLLSSNKITSEKIAEALDNSDKVKNLIK